MELDQNQQLDSMTLLKDPSFFQAVKEENAKAAAMLDLVSGWKGNVRKWLRLQNELTMTASNSHSRKCKSSLLLWNIQLLLTNQEIHTKLLFMVIEGIPNLCTHFFSIHRLNRKIAQVPGGQYHTSSIDKTLICGEDTFRVVIYSG